MIFFAYDTNLNKIEKASKLDDYKCANYYRVYGLKQEDNPPVLIEYKELPAGKSEKDIKTLLKRNGIPVVFEKKQFGDVSIGLRKDLRMDIFLAAAVCNAIIGYLEDKVKLNKEFSFGFGKIEKTLLKKEVDNSIFVS